MILHHSSTLASAHRAASDAAERTGITYWYFPELEVITSRSTISVSGRQVLALPPELDFNMFVGAVKMFQKMTRKNMSDPTTGSVNETPHRK